MQINLQFSEREYLRGEASEIVQIEQKTKFSPQKIHHSCVPSVLSVATLCYAKNREP